MSGRAEAKPTSRRAGTPPRADALPAIAPANDAPRIIGRYALYGEFASGGMASVHAGRALGAVGFSRVVAIKRLHGSYAKDPEFVSMFVDEARLAARIHHPNVVSTLDVVRTDGELFVVMEYVHGLSLASLLTLVKKKRAQVPLPIAMAIATGMLDGLHAAHEATSEDGAPLAIVHRDVSPQNILVGVDGVARVIDFGVAKAAGRLQTTLDGQLKGKLAYMAREQLEHGVVDRQTDVYAASVVLWELLTQRRLFRGESEGQTVTMVLVGASEPPSVFREQVPTELDRIVMRGLSTDPAARWSSAHEMALALERALPAAPSREVGAWLQELAGEELAARAQRVREIDEEATRIVAGRTGAAGGLAAGHESGEASAPAATHAPQPEPPRTHRRLLVPLLLAALLAAVGTLGVVSVRLARRDADGAPRAATPTAMASATSPASATPHPETGSDAGANVGTVTTPTPVAAAVTTTATTPPRPPRPKSASGAPKSGCNPPYTVDENGVHRFKRECLGAK